MIAHPMTRFPAAAAVLGLLPALAGARVLQVGPGKTYAKPSLAAAAAKDGDTVLIDPGVYAGDVCTWDADNLVLKATAPYAHMRADGKEEGGKGTWVLYGSNTTVENIEFSGSSVPDQNGCGIRADGNGLTVRHCYFHDNEEGILGGGDGKSAVVIENSEFANNGYGDGQSHNMYIGEVASFTLKFCNTRSAKIGHLVKTRAKVNYILYNRIMDEAAGTSSYQVDIPNGGTSYIIGNVMQQGPENDNPTFIAYGEEGMANPGKDLYVINNTMVNDAGSGTFIDVAGGTVLKAWNNLMAGPGKAPWGADTAANLVSANPGFVDRAKYDYRLLATSPAVDKGRDPGAANGFALAPAFVYVANLGSAARAARGALDLGAYEYDPNSSIRAPRAGRRPKTGLFILEVQGKAPALDVLARRNARPGAGAYLFGDAERAR